MAEVYNFVHVRFRKALTRRVAWVDDAKRAHVYALRAGLPDRGGELFRVQAPVLRLIERVGDRGGVEECDSRTVERVLRDRDHDARAGSLGEDLEDVLDARRGSLREEDLGGVGRVAVAAFNEASNILTDVRDALRMRVCANAANVVQEELCALDRVRWVELEQELAVLWRKEIWVVDQRGYLTEKGDGLLIELLRVADVAINDSLEGEGVALGQFL
ncbi:hypothetical protein BC936DRAFT_138843, partial [Jimgerdemannia flammicorona]